ncbi:unnamed protein product [Prunus armeniaca]
MSMYEEYTPRLDGGIHIRSGNVNSTPQTVNGNSQDVDDIMDDWIKVVEESEKVVVAYEVDTYLHDPLELTTKELLQKDILAIQVSTVASESCFSTGGKKDEPTPEEYEFYESVELEYASTKLLPLVQHIRD